MQKFVNEKIMPVATSIQNNKWVKLLMSAMMGAMPATMIGAIFSMINSLPLGSWYTNFLASSGIGPALSSVANICNLIAVFSAVGIGYNMAKMYGHDTFQGAVVALVSFLIVTPTTVQSGDAVVSNVFSQTYLGSRGLFCAFIIGILGYQIFRYVLERGIVIKMPDSVPPMIANSFVGIIPALATGVVMFAIRMGFAASSFGNIHDFIYKILQAPLSSLGNTIPSFYIGLLFILVLWLCGIHGTMLVLGVVRILWEPAYYENLEAFNNSLQMPYAYTQTVVRFVMQFVGGPGNLLALAICCVLFARSSRYKALAKVTAVPDFFNIIEPTVYGYPIVANPFFVVPFILAPMVNLTLSFVLIKLNILPLPALLCGVMATPGPIAAWMIGGGWQWGVYWWVMLAIAIVIYFPFFKAADNAAMKEEQENLEKE